MFGLGPIPAAVTIISVLLIWRHRSNIGKLISGTESRIGGSRRAASAKTADRP